MNLPSPPAETGTTFSANAKLKAEFWCKQTGYPTLADDSGILVAALAAELGVETRRWGAGETATDSAWLEFFLRRMATEKNREAEFVCVLALAWPGQPTKIFTGQVTGQITTEIAAPLLPGIPLSSVFQPTGSSKVFAAMSSTEKNNFSHRGRALQKFLEFFKKHKPGWED